MSTYTITHHARVRFVQRLIGIPDESEAEMILSKHGYLVERWIRSLFRQAHEIKAPLWRKETGVKLMLKDNAIFVVRRNRNKKRYVLTVIDRRSYFQTERKRLAELTRHMS